MERALSENQMPLWASGSDTSEDAAKSIYRISGKQRSEVYRYIQGQGIRGSTCDEAEIALGMIHQNCSARFYELTKGGHLLISNLKRKTRSGRNARVYITAVNARLATSKGVTWMEG